MHQSSKQTHHLQQGWLAASSRSCSSIMLFKSSMSCVCFCMIAFCNSFRNSVRTSSLTRTSIEHCNSSMSLMRFSKERNASLRLYTQVQYTLKIRLKATTYGLVELFIIVSTPVDDKKINVVVRITSAHICHFHTHTYGHFGQWLCWNMTNALLATILQFFLSHQEYQNIMTLCRQCYRQSR